MRFPLMQAVQCDGDGVELVELRRARPATGQVLVRVEAVALDRRDGEPAAGPRPMTFGAAGRRTMGRHVVGTVAAPGAGVDGWPLGRPVALQPEAVGRGWFAPGTEHDGGCAEYVAVPVAGLVTLPRNLPLAEATVLPRAARAYSMLTHARLKPGESVGIWGAGALGGAAVAVARLLGAAPIVVVDPEERSRAEALTLGADEALTPDDPDLGERLRQLTGGGGLAVGIHAASQTPAAAQMFAALASAGRGILAGPASPLSTGDRWDGRTLSGPPRVDPAALPLLAQLASQERLRLPVPPTLPGGLAAAARVLDEAVRHEQALDSCLVPL